eukprot:2884266-Rhodomonas_salina.1
MTSPASLDPSPMSTMSGFSSPLITSPCREDGGRDQCTGKDEYLRQVKPQDSAGTEACCALRVD